jgi:hypothetical protein
LERLDPEEAAGLALTSALVLIFGGGLVFAGLAIVVGVTHGLAGVEHRRRLGKPARDCLLDVRAQASH